MSESTDFWRVPADNPQFWDAYIDTRPVYSQGFYDKIFNYHDKHSSTWDVAHDIGCGAGQLTAKLHTRFKNVVASDCNDTHLEAAQRRLSHLSPPDSISYTLAKGEDMLNHYPHGSTDLVICAEVMPIMDEKQALHSFHTLLQPGGTLAIQFYGCPAFAEPEYAKYQNILDDIMEYHWTTALRPGGTTIPDGMLAVLSQAANSMASWLDYVSFDESQWTDVHRIKWNKSIASLPFFDQRTTGVPIRAVSNVKPTEHVEEIEDSNWWSNEWTIHDLKQYFRVLFPGFRGTIGEGDEKLKVLFDLLEQKMGGSEAVRKITWPVVLILATKK